MEDSRKGWDDSLISLGLGALVVVVSGILLYNFFSNTSQDLLKDISTSMQTSREEEQLASPAFAPTEIVPADTPFPLAQVQTESQGELVAQGSPESLSVSVLPTQEVVSVANPVASIMPETQVQTVETVVNQSATTFEGTVSDSYTVQAGDSLWRIAERFYGDGFRWREIARANNISNPRKLERGLALSVPRVGMISSASTVVGQTASATARDEGSASVTTSVGVGGGAVVVDNEAQKQEIAGEGVYVVQRGENLSSIVQRQCGRGTSWTQVARDNKLANPRVIHAGNRLQIHCNS